jgi:hypothetical protein
MVNRFELVPEQLEKWYISLASLKNDSHQGFTGAASIAA